MKKQLILSFILLMTLNSFCQNIQILERFVTYNPTTKPTEFHYLDNNLESSKSMKIAIIKGTFKFTKKTTLIDLFALFKNFSNNNGANSFRIESKSLNVDNDSSFVILSIYSTSESYLEENYNLYQKNKVFIIGSLNPKTKSLQKVKLNKKAVLIGSLEFFEYQNTDGATLRLNIGGFTGTTIKLHGDKNRSSVFYSLSGISITPTSIYPIGVGVNTGNFYPMDENLGYFLKEILLPTSNYSQ
ncbi:MAG: hypothetical protein K9J13_17310 [Saprospiraceae bacterium]|nr:hypothetical protein [Saprospiraceae bacterium]